MCALALFTPKHGWGRGSVLAGMLCSVLMPPKVSDHIADLYRLKIPGPCFHPDKTRANPAQKIRLHTAR